MNFRLNQILNRINLVKSDGLLFGENDFEGEDKLNFGQKFLKEEGLQKY